MKLLILSDLHLESGIPWDVPPEIEFDATVLAGDIHSPGAKAIGWAQSHPALAAKPVVYVPGNHEFYGAPSLDSEMSAMQKSAEGSNVHLLNRSSAVIGGVRFLGCVLWTDFQLPVLADRRPDVDVAKALQTGNQCLMDFQAIQVTAAAVRESRPREFKRLLRAEDTLAMHWVDRDWLRRELMKPFGGTTVVVTHHAPALGSVAPKYADDPVTPCFVSDLPDGFFEIPTLWIHGHTHWPCDYQQGRCRVLSNPRGYRMKDGSFENRSYSSDLVVHL